jgi:hypothetical protein
MAKKKGEGPKIANAMPAGSIDLANPTGLDIEAEVSPAMEDPKRAPKKGPRMVHEVVDKDPLGVNTPAGDVNVEVTGEDFLQEAAKRDRKDAKAEHVDKGLDAATKMVDRMRKGLAYAATLKDFEVKLAVLSEVAATAADVADDAERAVEAARKETRNVQR